jgi:hypothetical protein
MTVDVLPQIYRTVRAYEPIKKHFVAMLEGNHDAKLWRFGNIVAHICREMWGEYSKYATLTCKINWVDQDTNEIMFKQFATHGRRSIRSNSPDPIRREANVKYQLRDRLYRKAGDAFLMTRGHVHQLFHSAPMREMFLYDDDKTIVSDYTGISQSRRWIHPDHRWYISVGSFYRVYGSELHEYDPEDPYHSVMSSYVEAGDYDPAQLGYAVTLVRNGQIVEVKEEYVS